MMRKRNENGIMKKKGFGRLPEDDGESDYPSAVRSRALRFCQTATMQRRRCAPRTTVDFVFTNEVTFSDCSFNLGGSEIPAEVGVAVPRGLLYN